MEYGPLGWDLSLAQGLNLDLKAGIWASRLGFELERKGVDGGEREGEEKKKSPYV